MGHSILASFNNYQSLSIANQSNTDLGLITVQIFDFVLVLLNGMKCPNWSIVSQASHLENNIVNDGGDDEGEDNKAINEAKLEREIKCIFAIQERNKKP